jgi:hypothetical protein
MTRRRLPEKTSVKEPEIRFTLHTRSSTPEQMDAGKRLFKRLIDRAYNNGNLSLENGIGCCPGEAVTKRSGSRWNEQEQTGKRGSKSGTV